MRSAFLVLAAAVACWLAPAVASAQVVSIATTKPVTWPNPRSLVDDEINRADCLNNTKIRFGLSVSGATGVLEGWAGAGTEDCSDDDRRALNTTTCWQVFSQEVTNSTIYEVEVQDIVGQRTPGTDRAGPGNGSDEDCDAPSGTAPQGVKIAFFFVDSSKKVGTAAFWDARYDTKPPEAPSDVAAGPGENALIVDVGNEPSGDFKGYRFYCAPVDGGSPDSGDGGNSGDGGGSGDGDSGDGKSEGGDSGDGDGDSSCRTSAFEEGEDPPSNLSPCGSTSTPRSDSGRASGLENGRRYAVAVAAYDAFENEGKLSNLACDVPEAVTGFYEQYRLDGGKAGGGFCSFAVPARGHAAGWATVAAALGLAAALRRRRR